MTADDMVHAAFRHCTVNAFQGSRGSVGTETSVLTLEITDSMKYLMKLPVDATHPSIGHIFTLPSNPINYTYSLRTHPRTDLLCPPFFLF